nr:hypothetical protein [Tanacetum cinerariifolium]
MANSNNLYASPAPHQDLSPFNQNYIQQPMSNPEDIMDPTTAMNMALALMAKAFKLNYSTPTNNNQRISSNPRNMQIAQPGMNMGQDRQIQMIGGNGGNQFRQYAGQNAGNTAGFNDVIGNRVIQNAAQNPMVQNVGNPNGLMGVQGNGNLVAVRAEGNAAGHNGNQIRCYNCRGYTELLEPIPEPQQVPQNDNVFISEVIGVKQDGETVEQHSANFEETRALYESLYQNLAVEVEKVNSVNRKLKETNADLTTELASQSIQTIHMLLPKPNSFYHIEQKMTLGYQNPFYLKQSQKKQQSLYDGKVLLAKHDPIVVHDSEETLQLAQESRQKMKQMNKEIKPANYTKINHLSGVFVPQNALSREELYFSNNSKIANVSKSFLIPNEDLSDDTTPSVALVSQDIMIIVQNESVVDTSDLQTELNGGNQFRQYAGQNAGNLNGGVGHFARECTARPRRRDAAYLQTQLLIAQKEEAGIQLQAEDAPVYDSDGSAEVHENYDNNEIFNMFTQEEQYTELLEPIPEPQQVPQNDNEVISEVTDVEQDGEIVEQHSANFEETRALYDSLYQNLAVEVEKVNSVNRKSK